MQSQNERRERLIILSRSITQLSKKLIFHLHRGATLPSPIAREKNLKDGRGMQANIVDVFAKVGAELKGKESPESYWKWNRQV